MKFRGISILFSLFFTLGAGDPKTLELVGKYSAAEMNVQGQLYVIDEANNLLLFSQKGDTLKKISVTNYGSDPLIDASNPLEPVVFFPVTGKAVWMDNQLNTQNELDIIKAGITQISGFGRSNDGNVWVVDYNTKSLKKIGKNGGVLQESVWLSDYQWGGKTNRVYDNGQQVVFADGREHVFVFDQNLNLKTRRKGREELVGIGAEKLYLMDGNFLTDVRHEGILHETKDTIFLTKDSTQMLAVNSGFVLMRSRSGVILQSK